METRLTRLCRRHDDVMMAIPHPGSAQTAEETNIKLIKDYYAAYATGDPEALRPFLADGPVD